MSNRTANLEPDVSRRLPARGGIGKYDSRHFDEHGRRKQK